MMNSGQVSQMFAQQNQMFAGNASYSQQISSQMPSMYNSQFGNQGFAYGGQAPLGYDLGSRASGGIMSAMGGAAHFAMGAGSLMAGLGFGGAARYALDPFMGAGAMYKAGGAMGMGMGGRLAMGAAGMLPAAGLMAGASHVIGSVMSGAQEQAGIERTLGQNFNFMNPATGGKGFNRQQGMAIGDMVRQLEHMPEMMTSVGELTKIMDKMGQMGIMNGVSNVKDFGSKFKQTLGVLREMSKVIGSTMEEALPLFGEIRRSGMYSTSDILKNAMQRQVVGGMTGMNQQQVGNVASYGSQLGFATGGSRATGAQHALRMAGQLGMANQMGILSNNQITEMTGMEGAEGIEALSGQLTQAGYRMSQGALGTAMSIAMAEQKDGKFTGKMDAKLMERFRSGGISKSEMLSMVHSKTGSRGAKMSYVTKKGELRSEMAGQMGVEGQLNMLGMVLGERGYDNPDALNIVSQGFGLDERESGMLVELGKKMPDINLEMKQRGRSEAKRIAQDSFMKQNYSWDAIKSKVGKKIEGVITEPFKKFGADLRNSINQTIDEFVDDMTGRYKVEVSQGMSALIKGSGSGTGDYRSRLQGMMSGGAGKSASFASRGGDMTTGRLASFTNWMTGSTTGGEHAASALQAINPDYVEHMTTDDYSRISGMRDQGYTALSRDRSMFGRDDWQLANQSDIGKAYKRYQDISLGTAKNAGVTAGMSSGQLNKAGRELMLARTYGTAGGDGGDYFQGLVGSAGEGSVLGKLAGRSSSVEAIYAASQQGGLGLSSKEQEELEKARSYISGIGGSQADLAKRITKAETGGGLSGILGNENAESFMGFVKERSGTGSFDPFNAMLNKKYANSSFEETGVQSRINVDRVRSGMSRMGTSMIGAGEAGAAFSRAFGGSSAEQGRVETYLREAAATQIQGKEKLSKDAVAIIGSQKSAYDAIYNEVMMNQVATKGESGSTSWTEDEKKFLSKMGYDSPDKFTKEEAKKLGDMGKMLTSANLDPAKRGELRQYISDKGGEAFTEVASRLQNQGREIGTRVASSRAAGGMSAAGSGMLSRVGVLAGRMEGARIGDGGFANAVAPNKGNSVFQEMGDIAYQLTSGKYGQKDVDRILATSDDISAAYSRAQYAKKGGKSGHAKFDDYFDETALIKAGRGGEVSSIRDRYFDKGGGLKDKEGFAKYLAGEEGAKNLTAGGAEQRSKYASQADIAKNMESFGQNVATLASIVQQMKDGKQPGGTK